MQYLRKTRQASWNSPRSDQSIEELLGDTNPKVSPPQPETVEEIISTSPQIQRQIEELKHKIASETLGRMAGDNTLEQLIADVNKVWKIKLESVERKVDETRRVEIQLTQADGEARTLDTSQHYHPKFETLLRLCSARDITGFAPNIWIAGPAGSGKTSAVRQVANALGYNFFFNGAINMEHKLLGFKDAMGNYHETPFFKAYPTPKSIYLFDDVDSSDNAATLPFNAALANGECDFPTGTVKRAPDTIIIATANTWGLGATADYVGRQKQDAAFLSRFPAKLQWGYDEAFERQICGNAQWALRIQKARANAFAAGLKVIIDPRQSICGAALIAAGFSFAETADLTYLASLDASQRKIVETGIA